MSNNSTELMLQVLSVVKERANRAERDFDSRAAALQRSASKNIDLFGGNAVSSAVDIVSESRKILD